MRDLTVKIPGRKRRGSNGAREPIPRMPPRAKGYIVLALWAMFALGFGSAWWTWERWYGGMRGQLQEYLDRATHQLEEARELQDRVEEELERLRQRKAGDRHVS